jgi:hypothetical protein
VNTLKCHGRLRWHSRKSALQQFAITTYSRPCCGISQPGYLALRILQQILQVEIHVVFAQYIVAQGSFVINSNLESAVHKLLIKEGERLIEGDVMATTLKENLTQSAQLK